jgi:hypothetical protein
MVVEVHGSALVTELDKERGVQSQCKPSVAEACCGMPSTSQSDRPFADER